MWATPTSSNLDLAEKFGSQVLLFPVEDSGSCNPNTYLEGIRLKEHGLEIFAAIWVFGRYIQHSEWKVG